MTSIGSGRKAQEGEQPIAGLLQTVGDAATAQAPFLEEGLALGDRLAGRLGIDHVAIVGLDLLVQRRGRMGQRVAFLMHGAALHRYARPSYCRTELQGRLGHIG